eukprot:gene3349-3632_t
MPPVAQQTPLTAQQELLFLPRTHLAVVLALRGGRGTCPSYRWGYEMTEALESIAQSHNPRYAQNQVLYKKALEEGGNKNLLKHFLAHQELIDEDKDKPQMKLTEAVPGQDGVTAPASALDGPGAADDDNSPNAAGGGAKSAAGALGVGELDAIVRGIPLGLTTEKDRRQRELFHETQLLFSSATHSDDGGVRPCSA